MMRIFGIGLATALAAALLPQVAPSADAAEKAGSPKSKAVTERELMDKLGIAHRSRAKGGNTGDDARHLNFRMQEKMSQHSQARTIQSGVAKKQDETKKGMVKKMK